MIPQTDLADILAEQEKANELFQTGAAKRYAAAVAKIQRELDSVNTAWQQSAAYVEYTARVACLNARVASLPKPADVLAGEAAAAKATKLTDDLKKVYRKDSQVEAGPLKLYAVSTGSTQWEKVHDALAALPAVGKALLEAAAVAILKQARKKDVTAVGFVTQSFSRFEVAKDRDWNPAVPAAE